MPLLQPARAFVLRRHPPFSLLRALLAAALLCTATHAQRDILPANVRAHAVRKLQAQSPSGTSAPCPPFSYAYPASSCSSALRDCSISDALVWVRPSCFAAPYLAYCLNGYTLAVNVAAGGELTFDSPFWTNASVLLPAPLTRANVRSQDAKLQPFFDTPATNIMLLNPAANTSLYLQVTTSLSLSSIFASDAQPAVETLGINASWARPSMFWLNLVYGTTAMDFRGQLNCNFVAFNGGIPNRNDGSVRMRLGISLNNEDSCYTNDAWVGIGYSSAPTSGALGWLSQPQTLSIFVYEPLSVSVSCSSTFTPSTTQTGGTPSNSPTPSRTPSSSVTAPNTPSVTGTPCPPNSYASPASGCSSALRDCSISDALVWVRPSCIAAPYLAYCLNGYTLAINVAAGGELTFDSPFWTNASVLLPAPLTRANVRSQDAKLQPFFDTPATNIMLLNPAANTNLYLRVDTSLSLGAIFTSGAQPTVETLGINASWARPSMFWLNLVYGTTAMDFRGQLNCNFVTFNGGIANGNGAGGRMRLGISLNNEFDCWTNDAWAGIGFPSQPASGALGWLSQPQTLSIFVYTPLSTTCSSTFTPSSVPSGGISSSPLPSPTPSGATTLTTSRTSSGAGSPSQTVSPQLLSSSSTPSTSPLTLMRACSDARFAGRMTLSSGWYHTCALTATAGTPVCWGFRDYGATAIPLAATSDQVAISGGIAHTCTLSAAGVISCWGGVGNENGVSNDRGQLTVPAAASVNQFSIVAGGWHTCALSAAGCVTATTQTDRLPCLAPLCPTKLLLQLVGIIPVPCQHLVALHAGAASRPLRHQIKWPYHQVLCTLALCHQRAVSLAGLTTRQLLLPPPAKLLSPQATASRAPFQHLAVSFAGAPTITDSSMFHPGPLSIKLPLHRAPTTSAPCQQ